MSSAYSTLHNILSATDARSSIPTGALAIGLLVAAMPSNFESTGSGTHSGIKQLVSRQGLQRLDLLGAGLLLSGSLLLITALVEASLRFDWSSGAIIALIVLSGASWIAFFAWEWYITRKQGKQEPIFPWRFFQNIPWLGMLM
jgi:hypothetical protein